MHRERAVETLVSKKDGTEYDLCEQCKELLTTILNGMENDGRDRVSEVAEGASSKVAKPVPARSRPR